MQLSFERIRTAWLDPGQGFERKYFLEVIPKIFPILLATWEKLVDVYRET